MKLHCMVYILGPFISPSLTLLLVPDWFILGEELPSSSLQLSWSGSWCPHLFSCSCSGLGWEDAVWKWFISRLWLGCVFTRDLSLQVSSAWPAHCLFPSQQHRWVSCTLYLRQPVINTPELGLSLGWKGLGKSRLSEPHSGVSDPGLKDTRAVFRFPHAITVVHVSPLGLSGEANG